MEAGGQRAAPAGKCPALKPCCLCLAARPQVRNFPSSRGTVVGIMKAGIGLSGAPYPALAPLLAPHPRSHFACPLVHPPTAPLGIHASRPATCTCSAPICILPCP